MPFSKFLMAAAVATMAVAPAVAAPTNPAASLSVATSARAGAGVTKQSRLGGENGGFLIAVGIGLVIIAAIIVIGSEGEETPSSP